METREPEREEVLASIDLVSHLLAVGQLGRAKDMALQQLAANPHDPGAFANLARVLLYSGESEDAVAACDAAIAIVPDWPGVWSIRSAALFRLGRFAAAEASILEAIRLDPDEAGFFLLYARILAGCGEERRALGMVRAALELDPDDDDAHQLFARLLHQVSPSKWEISEAVATRAVQLDPENADAHAVLGWIRLTSKRMHEAEQSFRTALELDPNDALAISGLGHVVMATAWWYKPFLWYGLTLSRFGTSLQLFVVIALWVFVSALHLHVSNPSGDSLITAVYFALCAYTWFAEPITRAILRRRYAWL